MNLLSDNPTLPIAENEILLRKLIHTAPQLLSKIAPDGFEKSPFFYYYHQTVKEMYEQYRRIRAMRFKDDKRENKPVPRNPTLLTLEEFTKGEYQPMPHHLPDEIIGMLCEQFSVLAGHHYLIYNQNKLTYNFDNTKEYDKIVEKIVKEDALSSKDHFFYSTYFCHPYKKTSRVDLYPIFLHIFEFLKAEGLGWYYRSNYLELLRNLKWEQEDRKSGNTQTDYIGHYESIAESWGIGKKDRRNPTKTVYPGLEKEFAKYGVQKPDIILKTYFEVFGKWPEGYPPKLTDYI